MALIHAMFAAAPGRVEAVNCNFNLRGEESRRDSEFVARICTEIGVPLHRLEFDARSFAANERVSEEMACRTLRYREFRRLRREFSLARIVVAHNADDNIETVLLNLFRGTGIRGLCGMAADDGEILRPLLGVPRTEILRYLDSIGADHVEDSSNSDDYYKRNFIRLNLLPLIEKKWPGVRKAMSATIDNLNGSRRICEAATEKSLAGCGEGFVPMERLDVFPDRRSLLHAVFAPYGATPLQLREMEATRREGASWKLPEGSVRLTREGFRFSALSESENSGFIIDEIEMNIELWYEICAARDNDTVYLPGCISRYEWIFPEPGMTMRPFGMRGKRKIADMLRDARVPYPERERYPVLVEKATSEVVWLPGIRRSECCKVSRQDREVTRIRRTVTSRSSVSAEP